MEWSEPGGLLHARFGAALTVDPVPLSELTRFRDRENHDAFSPLHRGCRVLTGAEEAHLASRGTRGAGRYTGASDAGKNDADNRADRVGDVDSFGSHGKSDGCAGSRTRGFDRRRTPHESRDEQRVESAPRVEPPRIEADSVRGRIRGEGGAHDSALAVALQAERCEVCERLLRVRWLETGGATPIVGGDCSVLGDPTDERGERDRSPVDLLLIEPCVATTPGSLGFLQPVTAHGSATVAE